MVIINILYLALGFERRTYKIHKLSKNVHGMKKKRKKNK